MCRISVLVALAIFTACVLGCGGGSGTGGNSNSPFVNIQNTRLDPKSLTVKSGTIVQWTNLDSSPAQVVSGTLLATGNHNVIDTIDITLTGFSPVSSTANFGDTIQFNNISGNPFSMEVLNADGSQVVPTVDFLIGEQKTVTFPGAGLYIFRKSGSSIFQGTLILFGRPNPDGRFQSPTLAHGEVYRVQFDAVNSYSYYAPNLDNPDQSFRTGTVVVQ